MNGGYSATCVFGLERRRKEEKKEEKGYTDVDNLKIGTIHIYWSDVHRLHITQRNLQSLGYCLLVQLLLVNPDMHSFQLIETS